MPANTTELEKKLWSSADELRANSSLTAAEYSIPVLGLIFLRFADQKFFQVEQELKASIAPGSRRTISKLDYQARGVMYLPPIARFQYLLELPDDKDIGQAINEAMKTIEEENEDLRGVLPRSYMRLDNAILKTLLKTFSGIPTDIEGDAFGKIYEYFLGKFAMAEGQRGGQFFTLTALVKLIVEIIEPFHGRILDPACGSGGMFVQSARFVLNHQRNPSQEVSLYGQEKTLETVRLCRMNLAVNGLSGNIKQANTYYENVHNCIGRFDFVMANPPFNVNGVDKEKIKDDPRYPLGMPRPDNANYLWIQEFYSALNEHGRAGFVMANSVSDARDSEQQIRAKLLQTHAVDAMVAIGPNFFYTVTLPCTLWFLDKGKRETSRRDTVLFIDARHIYRQLDRAHRDFTPDQNEFVANIVRLYRSEQPETVNGSLPRLQETFPNGTYADVLGLCKIATLSEIEAQGWSLNPGRYVGVAEKGNFKYSGGFRFESTTLKAYDGEYPEEFILKPDDILLVMTCQTSGGEILGIPGRIPNDARVYLHNQRMGKVVVTNQERVNLNFLYWLFLTRDFNNHLTATASGSKILHTAPSRIESFQFRLPPIKTQRKIASILSAYDDLIENNTRRIAILEEMARSLYQEWFVHFRFPGHEKNRMVESALGMIPEGWEVVKLGDVAYEVRKSINPDMVDPETPYLGLEHLPRKSIALSEWGTAREVQSTKLVFKKGEILFGKIRPYFHKVAVAPLDGVCSTDTIVILPRENKYYCLVLCCVSSDEFVDYATRTSQGTKMPRANWDVMLKYPVVLPPEPLLSRFDELVRELIANIQNLLFRNRSLQHMRDLLLPKLISGEIDVEDMDIEIANNGESDTELVEREVQEAVLMALWK